MAINVWIPSEVVEKILNREKTFDDYKFIVQCWEDDFIVQLLKWYDYKVSHIDYNKRNWHTCSDESRWRQYYEQMFRMLYYAVIQCKLREPDSLKDLFRDFFEVEDPYGRHPDLISAEKLLMVYNYIIKKIGKRSYKEDPLIGNWDTEQLKDLYEHVRSHQIFEVNNMECCFRYKEGKKKKKEKKAELVMDDDEAMKRDIKLLQEILDRMKLRVNRPDILIK